MHTALHTESSNALRELVRRAELAGTPRRALLLHTDRLPPALAKPHHQRLARAAIAGLGMADRAQPFELSRGRVAIVWRHRGGRELETALEALNHLLADLPADQAMPPGQLVSLYDLPEQGAWLLDELTEPETTPTHAPEGPGPPVTTAMLGRLEAMLMQADISSFLRWRPVLRIDPHGPADAPPATAWEERYVAAHDVAATLCPEHRIKADPWLFRRLTRTFDRRVLALLGTPQELRSTQGLGLHMNVATILSPDFLRFDAALPTHLRGAVTLYLQATDMLADPASFAFARSFARARGYRMLLRNASLPLLRLVDVAAAEFDFVQIAFTPELQADPGPVRALLPPGITPVLTGADTSAALAWGRAHGLVLARAR
jgi:hypothetical protein